MQPPHAVFALADSGIKMPKDLEGKTLADTAFSAIPLIFNGYAQAPASTRKSEMGYGDVYVAAVAARDRAVDAIGQFTVGEPSSRPRSSRRSWCGSPTRMRASTTTATESSPPSKRSKTIRTAEGFYARHPQGYARRLCQSSRGRSDLEQVSQRDFTGVATGETEMVEELAVVPGQHLGAIDEGASSGRSTSWAKHIR